MIRALVCAGVALVAEAHDLDSTGATGSYVVGDGDVFTIDDAKWDALAVTDAARSLPAGCSCVESKDTGCKFDCTCTCDLTPGQCDANCCCDGDCNAAQVAQFQAAYSFCQESATKVLSVSKCLSTASVAEVNPSYGLRTYDPDDGISGFLCVVKDNNPTKGNFYTAVATPQSDAVLDASGVAPLHSFKPVPLATLTSSTQTAFVPGDRLQATYAASGGVDATGLAAFGGYLPLPTAGIDGRCSTHNGVRFQTPVTENRCARTAVESTVTLSDACTQQFSWTPYMGANVLFVRKAYASSITVGVPSSAEYVPVEVGTIHVRDPSTGALTAAGSLPATAWDGTTCTNAVRSLHYQVTYSQLQAASGDTAESGGQVTRVVANVVLEPLTASGTGTSQSLSSEQEFLVDFLRAGGSNETRSRSGNPGYEMGRPVLAGSLVNNNAEGTETPKSAIAQVKDGLRVPFFADRAGACLKGTAAALDDQPAGQQVLFGHDLLVTCLLRGVTRADLKSMCEKDPDTVVASAGARDTTYGAYLNATAMPPRIGVFGNANYTNTDTSEWLEFQVNAPSGAGTFDTSTLICGGGGLVTSIDLEFLVAKSGAYLNPQSKIVAARASFGREDVQFVAETSDAGGTDTMDLVLATTVTFVNLGDEALEEYVPPAPPLLPEIPYDIFYPFLLSAAPAPAAVAPAVAFLAAAVAVAVMPVF